jgi:hypothetical protein
MALYEVEDQFAGYPVVVWKPGTPLADPAGRNYKILLSWDESEKKQRWSDKLAAFLEDPASRAVTGLVVGAWGDLSDGGDAREGDPNTVTAALEALVAAREQLPALTRLFFGDIAQEESEISWIGQTDVAPLLAAYPRLEHFGVRGGEGLAFSVDRHEQLRALEIEAGGLDRDIVQQVLAADLPALEHLELWLGDANYGANTTVADLQPLFTGPLFPKLRYLGLRNSEITDELAVALATAPIVERIQILDLSLGMLSDAGAEALLTSPAVRRLHKLDLHHHFCSDAMMARLKALPIEVNIADRQKPSVWGGESHRYVMVSE